MAACLSPSPSGRRLSELLEEQQEPFVLDLHLLEKGCSSRVLDGYDTALCWPAPGGNDAAAAVLKRLTSSKKQSKKTRHAVQQQKPGGLLKLLFSKVLRGKQQQAGRKKPAALQFSDSFKLAGSSKPAAVAPAPCAEEVLVTKEQEAERYSYDSDSDDEKQLSPVSVLEHPFESSPVHAKLFARSPPTKNKNLYAMDVFRDLLDAAYSPALLTQLLASSDDLATDTTDTTTTSSSSCSTHEDEDEDEYCYSASPKNAGAAYWETHRAELARVSELVASEVPNARLDHAAAEALVPEREDVGADVADAVFNALLHELVADLATC